LAWLERLIHAHDRRPLIVMSHHYIISAWGNRSTDLAEQIGDLVRGRIAAWYWGHEHGCVAYGYVPHGFLGACIGNGAFCEEFTPPVEKTPKPEWYPKSRCACYKKRANPFWPHGYLELELQPGRILEFYRLEGAETHRREFNPGDPSSKERSVTASKAAARKKNPRSKKKKR
jgi:hypothetical protein